jgi:hypothetical protein
MNATPGKWRRSRRSTSLGNACVEARLNPTTPQLRDSKLGDDSPLLELSRSDFEGFLRFAGSSPVS